MSLLISSSERQLLYPQIRYTAEKQIKRVTGNNRRKMSQIPKIKLENLNCFKRAGFSLDIMRLTACLVFNPIMVEGYAALFSCTAVVQASDSMTASM